MPRAKAQPQTAMDEIVLEDADAEAALEAYQSAREDAAPYVLARDKAKEAAHAAIDALDLGIGEPVRIGRFRVTLERIPERDVSFTSKARETPRIMLVD